MHLAQRLSFHHTHTMFSYSFHSLSTMAECHVVNVDDFVRTGRTGRRNAMPDILAAEHLQVSTAGLPEVLNKFSLTSTQNSNQEATPQNQPPTEKGS